MKQVFNPLKYSTKVYTDIYDIIGVKPSRTDMNPKLGSSYA